MPWRSRPIEPIGDVPVMVNDPPADMLNTADARSFAQAVGLVALRAAGRRRHSSPTHRTVQCRCLSARQRDRANANRRRLRLRATPFLLRHGSRLLLCQDRARDLWLQGATARPGAGTAIAQATATSRRRRAGPAAAQRAAAAGGPAVATRDEPGAQRSAALAFASGSSVGLAMLTDSGGDTPYPPNRW